jgi:hypothetical protein
MRELTENEMRELKGGEVVTVAAIMAMVVAALVAVIAYKLFTSSKGSTTIPGGFKFSWA